MPRTKYTPLLSAVNRALITVTRLSDDEKAIIKSSSAKAVQALADNRAPDIRHSPNSPIRLAEWIGDGPLISALYAIENAANETAVAARTARLDETTP